MLRVVDGPLGKRAITSRSDGLLPRNGCVRRTTSPYRPLISSGELPPALARARLLAPAAIRSTKRRIDLDVVEAAPLGFRAKTTIRSATSALFPLSSQNWTHAWAPRSASAEVMLSPCFASMLSFL